MKKRLGIVLLLVIISFSLSYGYKILHEVKIASLESIVPEEVIYYLYSYNLDKKIKEFQASDFFKQISTSPLYKEFIAPKLEQARQRTPILSELTEKDVALAIFSPGKFLFLVRVDPKKQVKIKKYIADFYLSLVTKDQVSYKGYKGIKITNYKLPQAKMTISYAFLSDIIVFGNSSDIIQKSVDLFRNQSHNSLLNNKDFQKVTAKIKKDPLLRIYKNNKRYYQDILQAYTSSSLQYQKSKDSKSVESFMNIKPFINLMNILEGYASYLDYDELKTGFVFKAYQTFNRSLDQENMLNIIAYDKKVDKNTLGLIPRDIIAYYGGSQDLLNLWKFLKTFYSAMHEMMKTEIENEPRYRQYKNQIDSMGFDDMLQRFESFLGVNIEKDILPLLGNNFGMVWVKVDDMDFPLGGLQMSSNVPGQESLPIIFPQFYSFIELKDKSKMQEIMEKIVKRLVENINQIIEEQKRNLQEKSSLQKQQDNKEQQQEIEEEKKFFQLSVDTYKDINISSMEMVDSPSDFLRPNYCILDKYIIFSLSPTLTKKVIDIYQTKYATLSSNLYFESAQNKISTDYSNIMFFDFKRMIDNIQATKFFNNLQANLSMNTQSKFSKEDADSILNILRNINTLTFTNRMLDSDTMESSCYVKIQGL